MIQSKNIAVLIGSLRKGSLNRKMANVLIALAPGSLKLEIVEIGMLQMYNQDLEVLPPAEWTRFRDQVKDCDGFLFVTPEYNRSVPAVLKNAIDIGSKPSGKNMWDKKPGAVVSVSPGAIGGFGANHHLRQSLFAVNVLAMQQPEAYIGNAAALFNDQGVLINDSTRSFLKKFMTEFADWVDRNAVQEDRLVQEGMKTSIVSN
jgi:chromate reductase